MAVGGDVGRQAPPGRADHAPVGIRGDRPFLAAQAHAPAAVPGDLHAAIVPDKGERGAPAQSALPVRREGEGTGSGGLLNSAVRTVPGHREATSADTMKKPTSWSPWTQAVYIASGAEMPSSAERVGQGQARRVHQPEARRRRGRIGDIDDVSVAVEGVERRGQLGRVGRDACVSSARGRVLDDLGQPQDDPWPGPGAPRRGERSRSMSAGRHQARLGRLAQDRGDASVGVLDVVDRVLGRLLLGQLDVEVDAHGRAASGEVPAGRVHADLARAARRA